jgi:hypothetical protein
MRRLPRGFEGQMGLSERGVDDVVLELFVYAYGYGGYSEHLGKFKARVRRVSRISVYRHENVA